MDLAGRLAEQRDVSGHRVYTASLERLLEDRRLQAHRIGAVVDEGSPYAAEIRFEAAPMCETLDA